MAFVKKTWKNRIAEYINRRLLTNEDGRTELVTVARDEGTISQEGDAFNAANMNDLEDRIEAGFTEVNQSLTKQEKNMFLLVCSAASINAKKNFTLNGKTFEIKFSYVDTKSASISVLIDGKIVSLLGMFWISGASNQYVNTGKLTMQISSYFEGFTTGANLGYKISALLIGNAGSPTVIFNIASYKLL